ncbi:MAG TPA: molecular chaperone [Gemmatimonas aurantiaca]|uniref:Uncharacterized protein n=2 Tax=Gemmatimonas aurantiaca TaxID=173480 RepID=C1A755_GEMAT|nr:fimbria/pilus periplasmic chaperone [Gemmatimonas aurantiaca]BAH38065.1 hypothetical protein GAU_1023 [Gemmatimonas aurantiaca T-27]HCT56839.1 molecular chaperone [Gemmatimonas aurantiaca]
MIRALNDRGHTNVWHAQEWIHETMRWVRIAAGVVALAATPLSAQSVLIAPTAIIIDANRPSTAITLVNTGTAPAEVSLTFTFGLPATDSAGNMHIKLDDAPADSLPSAVDFVHAYPARLVLPAGGRQVVRLVAAPQRKLEAREYWARLIVTSRQGRPLSLAAADAPSEAQVALDLEVRSVLAVFYRPAGVSTALDMAKPEARLANGQIETRVRLSRGGNAAFVGSVSAVLRDSVGRVYGKKDMPLGVYYDLEPLISLGLALVPKGTYELELSARAERPDVPDNMLLPAKVVKQRTIVVVP